MRQITIISIIAFFFTSCAVHQGTFAPGPYVENSIYNDIAIGVSQTYKVFGVGGVRYDALVLQAKHQMQLSRPLGIDEEYANVTVDVKHTNWPFVIQTKVTVSADVLKISQDSIGSKFSELYLKKIGGFNPQNELFSIGDTVLFNKVSKGVVLSFVDENKLRIQVVTDKKTLRTKVYSADKVYSLAKPFKGVSIGDVYTFEESSKGGNIKYGMGRVAGVGLKNLLILPHNSKNVKVMDYPLAK